jgi:hypothetical protein
VTQNELLPLALEQGLTRDQVITALSALIENNERYLARRHGYHTQTDAGYRASTANADAHGGGG